MRDEIFDRSYQAGREELHAGIDRLVARASDGLRVTFDAIHRVGWSAPWKRGDKQDCAGIA